MTNYSETFNYYDLAGIVFWGSLYEIVLILIVIIIPQFRLKPVFIYVVQYFYILIMSCIIYAFIFVPIANASTVIFWKLDYWRIGASPLIYVFLSLVIATMTFYFFRNKFAKRQ
jgi:hypothetical protein